jgi:FkbM family methyltransferase
MGIKNQILKIVRSVLNPAGYDILKYKTTYPAHIIRDLLDRNGIGLVLDVGANEGQYSAELRKAGYKGRIISFEPLHDAFHALKTKCSADPAWIAEKLALGDRNGTDIIHVSGHSPSSSLLPMTDLHTNSVPGSAYAGDESIELKTLDSIYSDLKVAGEKIFMKVDTQGYEMHVLEGAAQTLPLIAGLQLELSASALYEGEELYYTICRYVEEKGFRLVRIIPGYTNKSTGEMLQFDAVFFRK